VSLQTVRQGSRNDPTDASVLGMTQLVITAITDPPGLRLVGEVDIATAPMLRQALSEALAGTQADPQALTIDLTGVTFIDSTGLHELVEAARSEHSQRSITLRNPSPQVLRVIDIIGIGGLFRIETEDEGERST